MPQVILSGSLYICLTIVFYLSLSFNLLAQTDLGPAKELFKVENIEIIGTKKVEPEAVLQKISVKPDMVLDNYLLRENIQKIYSMKYFEYVEAQRIKKQGKDTLVFVVKEKPIIGQIFYRGNDEINDEDLSNQVASKQYSILDIKTIKADVKKIQKHYEEKGFYLASVDYELKKIDEDNIELIFKVKEFDKVKVKKISFLGNDAFTKQELKSIMETREEGLLSFMTDAGNFKEFNFQTDIERLKYFYKSKGHLQVNIGSPVVTVSEDKKWVFITIKLVEGPKFKVNDISFSGELLFDEQKLHNEIQLKEGDVYSEDKLRHDIQRLTEMYQDEGYAFANVLRTLSIVPGENKVNVQFSFEKGKIAYFGNISVTGNSKTRDKVIRRELRIHEGMRYSGSKLRISKENVNRLGFFEPNSVVFNTVARKGRDDVLDVEVNVKERNTGQITLGAGYSTASKGFLQASISQNNFLGRGQVLSFSLSLSGTSQTYNLGFTEPYLFDTRWTAGGDIFRTKNEASNSYKYKREGFDLRVGYPIYDYTRLYMTYKYQDTTLTDVNDPTVDPVIENGVASSVENSIIHDKRNNKFEPSEGHYERLAAEYTGLGGDHKWVKIEAESRYYNNFYGDFVFRLRVAANKLFRINNQVIPRTERFTLGGARNLRGYDYEDIGPVETRKSNDPTDDRLYTFNRGGLFSLVNTYEVEHPLVREAGLKWVVFFDAGNIYENYFMEDGHLKLYTDYGFGLRWFSPIGVLRFEFGFPINREPHQAPNQFYFDIGQLF